MGWRYSIHSSPSWNLFVIPLPSGSSKKTSRRCWRRSQEVFVRYVFFSLLRFGIALCTWHWKCDVNSYHNATMVSCFHFRYGTRPFGPRNDFWRYTSIIIIYDLIYSIYLGYLKLGCIEDTLVGLSPLTTAIVTTAGFLSELKLHLVQLLGRGTTSMPEMPRKQNWLFLAHTKIRNHNILPWIKDPSQVATEGCVGNPVY